MKSVKHIIAAFIWFCAVQKAVAQDSLSLGDCIQLAELQNPTLRIARLSSERQRLELKYSKFYFLPTLSGNAGYNVNFGRRIDPFTNLFTTNTVQYNTYGLSTSLNLFDGLKNRRTVEANALLYEASENYRKGTKRQIRIDVIQGYYDCWEIEIQRQVTREKIADLQTQLDRIGLLLQEGRITVIDSLNAATQIDLEQIRLLNLDQQYKTELTRLSVSVGTENLTLKFPVLNPEATQADFSSIGAYELERAQTELDALYIERQKTKGNYLPTLTAFGSLGTGYSSNNLNYSATVPLPITYRDQLNQNLFQSVGISLQIPIYSRGENRKQEQLAGLSIEQKEEENRLLALKVEQQRREYEITLAKIKQETTLLEQVAGRVGKSYEQGKTLYEQGRINSFDLDELRNNYYEARRQFERAILEINRFVTISQYLTL